MLYNLAGLQGGIDLYCNEDAHGSSSMAGVYGAIGRGSGDIEVFAAPAGTNALNAFSMGGYYTHFGNNG